MDKQDNTLFVIGVVIGLIIGFVLGMAVSLIQYG